MPTPLKQVLGFSVALVAATAVEVSADPVTNLREEIQAMRVKLAQARLDLDRARRSLKEIQGFQASKAPAAEALAWERERQALAQERVTRAGERRQLETLKSTVRQAARDRGAEIDATKSAPDPSKPRLQVDYKIALVPLNGGAATYVDPVWGGSLLNRFPNVDTKHIMVRGTLQNRSTGSHRYTFEIRLAGRGKRPPVVGRWRYQTPVLAANQLHEFEVKVPVTHVADVHVYQIGNIEADRPEAAPSPTKAD